MLILRDRRWERLPNLGFPGGSAGKESACNSGNLGLTLGLGRSPGEWNGYPLQYSGLGNSLECIVHEGTKSRTPLSDFHFHMRKTDKKFKNNQQLKKNSMFPSAKTQYC